MLRRRGYLFQWVRNWKFLTNKADKAKILIVMGVEVNVRNTFGHTPLFYADEETKMILEEAGAHY
jgi:hypothetical protein